MVTVYSHCPICGAPLDNYNDVGAKKHIDRCIQLRDRRAHTLKGPMGRPRTHEPVQTPGKKKGKQ